MSMFLDQPAPINIHSLEEIALDGPSGGPIYRYRGAHIECTKGARICRLSMLNHPISGGTFSAPDIIMSLIDQWLEEQRLLPDLGQ